jgi:hypothetical protein
LVAQHFPEPSTADSYNRKRIYSFVGTLPKECHGVYNQKFIGLKMNSWKELKGGRIPRIFIDLTTVRE